MPKIIGGLTSTTMPVPDWEQTNPMRADYIKNKPVIPEVDQEFNIVSTNAIANRIVYEKLIEHEQSINGNTSNADAAHERISNFEEAYATDIMTLTNATDQLYNDFEEVKQHLGDIETALDGIIAIQNGLIGGGAV